jgi:hypothetical protein
MAAKGFPMKKVAFWIGFLSLSLALPELAQGDTETAQSVPGASLKGRGKGHGGRHGKSEAGGDKRIKGHCEILPSPMNPLSGPCVSVLLVLKDAEGKEVGISRTDSQGKFEFLLDEDGSFTLGPSSGRYEVVSPKGPVKIGGGLDIKIREKN